jgi:hypothetical protein
MITIAEGNGAEISELLSDRAGCYLLTKEYNRKSLINRLYSLQCVS